MELIIQLISAVYNFLWGDLFTIPLPGGNSMGVSLLVLLLIPTGIYFTIRTRAMPLRLFPEMLRVTVEKRSHSHLGSISGLQALVVSTATRVGMGNLVGSTSRRIPCTAATGAARPTISINMLNGSWAASPAATLWSRCSLPSPV